MDGNVFGDIVRLLEDGATPSDASVSHGRSLEDEAFDDAKFDAFSDAFGSAFSSSATGARPILPAKASSVASGSTTLVPVASHGGSESEPAFEEPFLMADMHRDDIADDLSVSSYTPASCTQGADKDPATAGCDLGRQAQQLHICTLASKSSLLSGSADCGSADLSILDDAAWCLQLHIERADPGVLPATFFRQRCGLAGRNTDDLLSISEFRRIVRGDLEVSCAELPDGDLDQLILSFSYGDAERLNIEELSHFVKRGAAAHHSEDSGQTTPVANG